MRYRPILVAVLRMSFGAAAGITAAPAYGCSCVEIQVHEAIDEHTAAAFIGTAVAVQERPDGGGVAGGGFVEPLVWTFEVETVLKGEVPGEVQVGSGLGDADCGYDFTNAGRVGVVAYGNGGGLSTGICGGVWDADTLLDAYGPGTAPTPLTVGPIDGPVETGPPQWFWWTLGSAALAAVGLLALGRRRGSFQDGWGEGIED